MQCDQIEVYLSGYIDGELPQQQRQGVEAHLASCADCRRLLEQLRGIATETRRLSYQLPTERDWKKMETNIFQTVSRGVGWLILIVWVVFTTGYALFHLATAPDEPLVEKILVFSLFLGLGLLFLSVLTERVREARTDRYRGIQR